MRRFATPTLPSVCLVFILAALLAQPAAADPVIWLDVSIKVIVDPATGQVPATMSDALLRDSFDDMNRWLANTWRGYRVRAVDLDSSQDFMRIGGLYDTTGPGFYYDKNLKHDPNDPNSIDPVSGTPWITLFEADAKANKALYGWNDSAINLYFNNGGYSSAGFPWPEDPSDPNSVRDVVQSAYRLFLYARPSGAAFTHSYVVAGNLLHEFGHWAGLCHTFDNSPCGVFGDTVLDPGTLRVPDTRNEPLVLDTVAQSAFDGRSYADLDDDEQTLVWNTANNAMSYYQLFYDEPSLGWVLTDEERFGPTRFIFTELQIDRWADWANTGRGLGATSGRTWFVKPGTQPGGLGSSTMEFQLIDQALAQASPAGGDILLLRPGVYGAPTVIPDPLDPKPLTLRATRDGTAVIGP